MTFLLGDTVDPELKNISVAITALSKDSGRVSRTHIHKFLFLAEGWGLLPKLHQFKFYHHGPYSYDLDGELRTFEAAAIVAAAPAADGWGALYRLSNELKSEIERDPDLSGASIERLGKELGRLNARALEALSTSEYLYRANLSSTDDALALGIRALKPHLREDEVAEGISRMHVLRSEFGVRDN